MKHVLESSMCNPLSQISDSKCTLRQFRNFPCFFLNLAPAAARNLQNRIIGAASSLGRIFSLNRYLFISDDYQVRRSFCAVYVTEAISAQVRAWIAAATLDHTARLSFCHNLASTLTAVFAARMDMVFAYSLIDQSLSEQRQQGRPGSRA